MIFSKNRSFKWALLSILSGVLAFLGPMAGSVVFSESERELLLQKNLAPIGKVSVQGGGVALSSTPVVLGPDAGKKVFAKGCAVCHTTGAAGAPKYADKAAWAPRMKAGEAVLIEHAIKGYKGMPAKGACPSCSDDEIKAAVDYMIAAVK